MPGMINGVQPKTFSLCIDLLPDIITLNLTKNCINRHLLKGVVKPVQAITKNSGSGQFSL